MFTDSGLKFINIAVASLNPDDFISVPFIPFSYCLINDAVNISDFVPSNDLMMTEYPNGNILERKYSGLISEKSTSAALS